MEGINDAQQDTAAISATAHQHRLAALQQKRAWPLLHTCSPLSLLSQLLPRKQAMPSARAGLWRLSPKISCAAYRYAKIRRRCQSIWAIRNGHGDHGASIGLHVGNGRIAKEVVGPDGKQGLVAVVYHQASIGRNAQGGRKLPVSKVIAKKLEKSIAGISAAAHGQYDSRFLAG
jgi:hypothetical protein